MTNSNDGGSSRDGAGGKKQPGKKPTSTATALAGRVNPPPPARALPPPAGGSGGGIQVGGGAEGGSSRAADISATRPQKRTWVARELEGTRAICAVCNREFASFKALFGHLRSHPNRPWRGSFPPPGAVEGEALNIDLNVRPQPQNNSPENDDLIDLNIRPPPSDDHNN